MRNMEEEKQGVEVEKRKVVKMKEDLEKERLRRAMGVNFQKFRNWGNGLSDQCISCSFCPVSLRTTNQPGHICCSAQNIDQNT